MPNRDYTKSKFQWLVEAIATCNESSCLLWPFFTDDGYGRVRYQGGVVRTHRLAFFLTRGHWPTPQACHTCDVRSCINPFHLFEGTNDDNMQDATRKMRKGKRLTPALVRAIRAELADPRVSQRSIAIRLGVNHYTIWAIAHGKTWKHVA